MPPSLVRRWRRRPIQRRTRHERCEWEDAAARGAEPLWSRRHSFVGARRTGWPWSGGWPWGNGAAAVDQFVEGATEGEGDPGERFHAGLHPSAFDVAEV